jgi:hypothetical protein
MFEIIPGGAKLYNVVQLAKTIGCRTSDLHLITKFISAWVCAFHPPSMGWFNPCSPDTSIKYSESEHPGYRRMR